MPTATNIGKQLFQKFALPSERKTIQKLQGIHALYESPYAASNLGKDLESSFVTDEDVVGNAVEHFLSSNTASFERHAPEAQGLARLVVNRAKKLSASRAAQVAAGVGVASQLMPEDAEAITPLQVVKAIKSWGSGTLTRDELARLAKGVRRVPRAELDKIGEIQVGTHAQLFGDLATDKKFQVWGQHTPAGMKAWAASANNQPVPETLKSDIVLTTDRLPKKLSHIEGRKLVPLHEISHEIVTNHVDDLNFLRLDDLVSPSKNLKLNRLLGGGLWGSEELTTEAFASFLAKDSKRFSLFPQEIQDLVRQTWTKVSSKKPLLALAGIVAGAEVGSLINPGEAEASPKTRITGSAWKALQEQAWPISKELLADKGPLEFDVARRWWSKKLGNGLLFWNHARDANKFLDWVEPHLKDVAVKDPKAAQSAKQMFDMGTKEGRPMYYELGLQILHRPKVHETPAIKAIEDLLQKHSSEDVAKALESQVKSPQQKEMLHEMLRNLDLLGVGAAATGIASILGGAQEAEAGKIPKLPKASGLAVDKLPRKAQEEVKRLILEWMGGAGKGTGINPGVEQLEEKISKVVGQEVSSAKTGTLGAVLPFERVGKGPKSPTKSIADIKDKVGGLSSASSRLEGMDLMGKTVKDVRKGRGNWRYITFEDGTYTVMDKKYIASLTSSEGEKAYTGMFDLLTKPHQTTMINRSQSIKQALRTPADMHEVKLAERSSLLKELGEETPERGRTTIHGREVNVPLSYSDWISKKGMPKPPEPKVKAAKPKPEKTVADIVQPSKKSATVQPKQTILQKSIANLEKTKAKRALSKGDEYMLRRFKGMSEEEAAKGLSLLSRGSIERMVKRILEESK